MWPKREAFMWGGEDPISPECSVQEAQYLLDIAYPQSQNQMFSIRMLKDNQGNIIKKLIKFHHVENRMWNGYVLKNNFQKVVSDKTFKAFSEAGFLIPSKKEN